MNEEIMNEIQPVRPKDQFPFSCRQCGACCRNIEGCVMVESLDAYRLARYLRTKGELIEGIEDFLFRYCDPEPLTEEGFPIFRKLAAVPTSRQSRYWDFIKDYADEQYAESCKEWSAFAEHKCAGLSVANKKYLADIFEKASLLELAFWKMAYRNERMEENAK